MKKTSLNKRILSLIMVLCLSFTMTTFTTAAFAEDGTNSVPGSNGTQAVINFGSDYLTNYVEIDLYLSKAYWNAGFYAAIVGNVGEEYEVDITTPGGTTITDYVVGGGGALTLISTMMLASAGTYRFEFYRITGDPVSALAVAQIGK